MKQSEKDLLLKDLCSRLPYGVKAEKYTIRLDGEFVPLANIETVTAKDIIDRDECPGYTIKPYLFPLSNVTEEQKNSFPFSYSFLEALIDGGVYFYEDECITLNDMICVIQWCYENHFDVHGLIPIGLAIDATGKNIY